MPDGEQSPGTRTRTAASGPRPRPPRESFRRHGLPASEPTPADYFERATCASFRMDGVPIRPAEVRAALAHGAGRAGRTRTAQRARNHVAVLRRIEILLRRGQPISTTDVVRWYTSVACGLSSGGITAPTLARIDRTVSAVNSPRLRFLPAVKEVAALHVALLGDPFVPGFNGIVARLLLRYHMGRCGLPPVVFDAEEDSPHMTSAAKLEPRLLELIATGAAKGSRTA